MLETFAELENVHINPHQAGHGPNYNDEHEHKRHMGDITLLLGDENGEAWFTRTDKLVTLYGPYSIFGRMADLHFSKSCVDFDNDKLGNIDPATPGAEKVNIKP